MLGWLEVGMKDHSLQGVESWEAQRSPLLISLLHRPAEISAKGSGDPLFTVGRFVCIVDE